MGFFIYVRDSAANDSDLLIQIQLGRCPMKESVLNGKWILGVNEDVDALRVLEEKIKETAPDCHFEKATTYREAFEFLVFFMYDLVILDNTLPRSRELLDFAVNRPFPVPVAIVTPSLAAPETLKLTKEAGAKVVLSMGKINGVVPVLEYIVWREQLPPLARFFEDLRESFNGRRLFSKNRGEKELKFSVPKNRMALKKGYKTDIILEGKHSYLKLKNHLNGYFESHPEKETILKWPELKSEIGIDGGPDVKI
jgi:hypothetical protein